MSTDQQQNQQERQQQQNRRFCLTQSTMQTTVKCPPFVSSAAPIVSAGTVGTASPEDTLSAPAGLPPSRSPTSTASRSMAQCKPSSSNIIAMSGRVTDTKGDPAIKECTHLSHTSMPSESSAQLLNIDQFERQLNQFCEKSSLSGGDAAKLNGHMNKIFLKRLCDIDCQANGDIDLKLSTYQDWVDMLLKINDTLVNNLEDLEVEVSERLELLQRKANCQHNPGNELSKCRKDIETLLKIIQNGYHHDNWNFQGLQFETLTQAQILGFHERQCITPGEQHQQQQQQQAQMQLSIDAEAAQRNKLIINMKALAVEVAEKHDEVRELKKQVLCLEDEIQKAQQKIQLKDDVIKELRNDLKNFSYKNVCTTYLDMPPVNLESQQATSRTTSTTLTTPDGLQSANQMFLNDDSSQYEALNHIEKLEHQKLKMLEDELNEMFIMAKDWKKQNLEYHRKRMLEIFQKMEVEKTEAHRKLDYIRQQLIDLEAASADVSLNDCDSGFSSKSENDQDAKIMETVRKRLRKLNDSTFELKKRVQKLEIANNELSTNLETEKTFSKHNSKALKDIADLLSGISGQQFSYNDIYNKKYEKNPFCESILRLKASFAERETRLMYNLNIQNKKIDELEEILFNYKQNLSSNPDTKTTHHDTTTPQHKN